MAIILPIIIYDIVMVAIPALGAFVNLIAGLQPEHADMANVAIVWGGWLSIMAMLMMVGLHAKGGTVAACLTVAMPFVTPHFWGSAVLISVVIILTAILWIPCLMHGD